jgi:hypothetical protein
MAQPLSRVQINAKPKKRRFMDKSESLQAQKYIGKRQRLKEM